MKKFLTILMITIFIGCAGETASVQEVDIDSTTPYTAMPLNLNPLEAAFV